MIVSTPFLYHLFTCVRYSRHLSFTLPWSAEYSYLRLSVRYDIQRALPFRGLLSTHTYVCLLSLIVPISIASDRPVHNPPKIVSTDAILVDQYLSSRIQPESPSQTPRATCIHKTTKLLINQYDTGERASSVLPVTRVGIKQKRDFLGSALLILRRSRK
ncbi:hypothetical protein L218DRAFT_130387 [Marasmius fiardii PR-910]|nr:hypothetical protein L218DRAFT_130387 [Marasmius fiardii PR-910]